jgi:hypothetical protein
MVLTCIVSYQQKTIRQINKNHIALVGDYKQLVNSWATVVRIQHTWLDVTASQQLRMERLDKRVDFCLGITESPGYKYVRGAELEP